MRWAGWMGRRGAGERGGVGAAGGGMHVWGFDGRSADIGWLGGGGGGWEAQGGGWVYKRIVNGF